MGVYFQEGVVLVRYFGPSPLTEVVYTSVVVF